MTEPATPTTSDFSAEVERFSSEPAEYFHWSDQQVHSIARDKHEQLLLGALKMRFTQLRDRVPILKKLADEQGIEQLSELDDVIPLLFSHTVYKSYPISLLEKGRFALLMRWLQKLTTVDLSQVDVSKCQGIDEWIALLDRETPIRLRTSSGTSGHMSFVPRTVAEGDRHFYSNMLGHFDRNGLRTPTPDNPQHLHVVVPQFRTGNTAILRSNHYFINDIAGADEEKIHFLYPGHQSSDLMFLAGRISAAEAMGELQRLELSPALMARRDEFESLARNQAGDTERFFATAIDQVRGQRIWASGTWNVLYNLAQAGLAKGVRGVLAPDSIIRAGGGAKGQIVPPDWEERVCEFLGVPALDHSYGMTEVMAGHHLCHAQRYHIEPWIILFVIDPDTGAALPRTGVQVGRAAYYDLLADTYWGGFVSGDEVSVDWTGQCECGRTTPHIARQIERYSLQRGGDDKITCAAAADAHDAALSYLNGSLQ